MTDERISTADIDRSLGFAIPGRHARGRLVRLGPVLDRILEAHAYPPVLSRVLAEALTLTALLGATLKDESGQMTMQAQTGGGAIDLMVCDYKGGELRGYLKHDPDKLAALPADPSLFALFGSGYLAITFDNETGQRYQGIVPLEGGTLAQAAESYFDQSEQLPSLCRIAVTESEEGGHVAGGLLIQHLPEGEEGRERLHTRDDHPEWDHVEAIGATIKADELTDRDLPLETIVWRLFHDEGDVRVLGGAALTRGCRCDPDYVAGVISRFPEAERREMADEDGVIRVDCAFCASVWPIPLEAVAGEAS